MTMTEATTYAEDCDRGPGCEWHPLEQLADILSERGDDRIHPWMFMYMGVTQSETGGHVYLFKHVDTRRYLNLDTSGHAYRYIAEHGAYVLQELAAAIKDIMTEDVTYKKGDRVVVTQGYWTGTGGRVLWSEDSRRMSVSLDGAYPRVFRWYELELGGSDKS